LVTDVSEQNIGPFFVGQEAFLGCLTLEEGTP